MSFTPDPLRPGQFLIPAQERILHGHEAGAAVRAEAERVGAERVFVVSTHSLSELADGPLQRVEAALGSLRAGTYAGMREHTLRQDVLNAAGLARDSGSDLLVAVGGGSALDGAKGVLLCLWQGITDVAGFDPYPNGAAPGVAKPITPPPGAIRMLSVSTTLSAADFTGMAGITDQQTGTKQAFVHRLMVPVTAVLDPAATLHTPPGLLFSTAIRSVDHAVECWCSPMATPVTEALSLQGLKLLSRALRDIQADPQDLRPRMTAQFGMWQAVAALASGVQTGASHGIGYALGAGYGVPHGHTSCVLLPAVLRWNAEVNAERQRALSEAMGQPGRPAHEAVAELVAALGLPGSLRAVGIEYRQLDELAERALNFPPVRANPRPITSAAEVRQILELAW